MKISAIYQETYLKIRIQLYNDETYLQYLLYEESLLYLLVITMLQL